jgi:TB2/DP1, HVA22 family
LNFECDLLIFENRISYFDNGYLHDTFRDDDDPTVACCFCFLQLPVVSSSSSKAKTLLLLQKNSRGVMAKRCTAASLTLLLLLLAFVSSFIFLPANAWSTPKRVAFSSSASLNTLSKISTLRGGGSGDGSTLNVLLQQQQQHQQARVRGGAVAVQDIDKSDTWSLSDVSAMDVLYVAIHGILLTAIVVFCRKMPRTGGRAPSWITNNSYLGIEDPYATVLLHVGYFALCALLPTLLLPAGLSRVIFSPPSVALLGTVFPAVESVRAAVTDSGSDDRTWLMYWVVHGLFQYSTEFIDQLALKSDLVYKYWHTFEVLVILWLVLPLTDGATLLYKSLAQPYLLPLVAPIKNTADSWIAGLALTTINASYLWWFSVIFMQLPVTVKRYAVMGVGSILPVASTIMALASTADNSEMRWLTYWPCFSLLFIIMIGVEKFVGRYVVCAYNFVGCASWRILLYCPPIFEPGISSFSKLL